MKGAQRVGFADKSRATSTACGRRPRPENPLPFSNKITAGKIIKICKGFSGRNYLLSANVFKCRDKCSEIQLTLRY